MYSTIKTHPAWKYYKKGRMFRIVSTAPEKSDVLNTIHGTWMLNDPANTEKAHRLAPHAVSHVQIAHRFII